MQSTGRTGPQDGLDELLAGLGAGAPAAVADSADEASDEPGFAGGSGSDSGSESDGGGGEGSGVKAHSAQLAAQVAPGSHTSSEGSSEQSVDDADMQVSDSEVAASGSGDSDEAADMSPPPPREQLPDGPGQNRKSRGAQPVSQAASLRAVPAGGSSETGSESGDDAGSIDSGAPGVAARDEALSPRTAAAAQSKAAQAQAGAAPQKYVPPARRNAAPASAAAAEAELARAATAAEAAERPELAAARRRVRSLLNRVATANLGGIARQLAELFMQAPRHLVIDTIVSSVMQVCLSRLRALPAPLFTCVRRAESCLACTTCLLLAHPAERVAPVPRMHNHTHARARHCCIRATPSGRAHRAARHARTGVRKHSGAVWCRLLQRARELQTSTPPSPPAS